MTRPLDLDGLLEIKLVGVIFTSGLVYSLEYWDSDAALDLAIEQAKLDVKKLEAGGRGAIVVRGTASLRRIP